ncbi:MAG: phosphoribosylaminoimidazolesuccinocarboxamide synthase [Coxiella sp. (in: Bacteria)]|nr:MAG: phosphoribosylaminoimidazolesuccinocarboxamide synthase [Coxiella sp. (in: g-proteobacteria)]
MSVVKKEVLYTGKAKTMYTTDDPELLITDFRDDTSAFDGVKKEKLQDKGRVNNKISAFIMEYLGSNGIPTHHVEKISDSECVVRRLTMIPLEGVVRNIAAGSLCRRLGIQEGLELSPPTFELFLKNDELHDPMVNQNHAIVFGWATQEQLDTILDYSLQINALLKKLLADAGLTLVDSKYEFGVGSDGKVYLGDEISPDSCRIWDSSSREILDKDRFRKDLGDVIKSYKIIAERLGIPD